MFRLINWVKRVFICWRKGHNYMHKVKKLRTFYCVNCGQCDPRITFPDGKRAIVATSQLPQEQQDS